jgi:hypothetical protein
MEEVYKRVYTTTDVRHWWECLRFLFARVTRSIIGSSDLVDGMPYVSWRGLRKVVRLVEVSFTGGDIGWRIRVPGESVARSAEATAYNYGTTGSVYERI